MNESMLPVARHLVSENRLRSSSNNEAMASNSMPTAVFRRGSAKCNVEGNSRLWIMNAMNNFQFHPYAHVIFQKESAR